MRNPGETGVLCRCTDWEKEFIPLEVTEVVLNNSL